MQGLVVSLLEKLEILRAIWCISYDFYADFKLFCYHFHKQNLAIDVHET